MSNVSSSLPFSPLPFSRILLTGGNGFVGSYLAPMLVAVAPDARRVMLVRPNTAAPPMNDWILAGAEIEDGDTVAELVRELQPDLVLHLAAQSSVGASQDVAESTWRVNFGGSLGLASACARHAPDATLLFVSSGETYGASLKDGPASEDSPQRPQNAYARSKAATELMLGDVLDPVNRLIVTRAFNHTGPGQDERFVLPSFAAQIARIEAGRQEPVMVVGNLDAARDFLDVRDVCSAYLALLTAAPLLPMRNVFNVSSGVGRQISGLLELLRAQATAPFEVCPDPARLRASDIRSAVGLSDRLREAVGWTPRHPIETTLYDMLQDARRVVAGG